MKKTALVYLLFLLSLSCLAQKNEIYLLVGTYTSGKSEGIYVYRFNQQSGEVRHVSTAITDNPSYLAVSPDEKFVYAVNEGLEDKGSVASFSFDKKTGELHFLNKQHSGDHPCYVTIDKNGKWVISANYTGGSLAVFPVQHDGSLGAATTVIEHEGSSVNPDRQAGPHVHSTVLSPDNRFLFASDLGTDKVMIYSFDPKDGSLKPGPMPFMPVEPGAGPRHFTFHPNHKFAYLIQELNGTVSAYSYDGKGLLDLIQDISALPFDYMGPVGSADIHLSPDGKFLYATNRGESNTIATFQVNQRTGQLVPAAHDSTMGKIPRNFNIDPSGNFLLVANQESDNIVIFRRDKATGMLTDTGTRIDISKPVCIQWISVK